MKKWKVTIIGTGIMGNSPKHIDEVFEIDDQTVKNLQNPASKSSVLKSLLSVRIPGIIIDTNKLQVTIEEKSTPIIDKNLKTAIVGGIIGAKIADKKKKKGKKRKKDEDEDNTIPFDDSLKEILTYKWNGNLLDTINKLEKISLLTNGYKWEFNPDEVGKENNRLLSQCLKQYNNGYKYYKKQIDFNKIKSGRNKLLLKKIVYLYGIYILLGIALITILILGFN